MRIAAKEIAVCEPASLKLNIALAAIPSVLVCHDLENNVCLPWMWEKQIPGNFKGGNRDTTWIRSCPWRKSKQNTSCPIVMWLQFLWNCEYTDSIWENYHNGSSGLVLRDNGIVDCSGLPDVNVITRRWRKRLRWINVLTVDKTRCASCCNVMQCLASFRPEAVM